MRLTTATTLLALLMGASTAFANVRITGVSLSPSTIGEGDSTTITVTGVITPNAFGQPNCTGVEIFFGDVIVPSTDPYKPAAAFVRFTSPSFPIHVSHSYAPKGSYTIIASQVKLYNGIYYQCGSVGNLAELTVLGDTIQSIKSITPAVINQQTSVVVKGLGNCNQNVQVSWGDGNTSTIPGPVDLRMGGVASHTYSSSGAKTASATGSVCDGNVSTTISVALLSRPGQTIDAMQLQQLRDRLDRYQKLPPPPGLPPGDPRCPICEGLVKQITLLDSVGHNLQLQSGVVVKDLDRGKALPMGAAITRELTRQIDDYLALRGQLFTQHAQALERARGPKGK